MDGLGGSISQEEWLLLVSVVHTFLLLRGIPLQERIFIKCFLNTRRASLVAQQ